MSYSSVVKKNMAAAYGGGKSSNSTYIVQKASGSTYGPATSAINGNASKHSSTQQYNNRYTNMKVNSHLLDHGYGATPQTSYDSTASARLSGEDTSQFKGFTNSIDAGITKYYKVSTLTESSVSVQQQANMLPCTFAVAFDSFKFHIYLYRVKTNVS